MNRPHPHCAHCGEAFDPEASWPRRCTGCQHEAFLNPTPVVVLLQPIREGGYLCVRRDIDPHRGELSLPGGFVDLGERWQQTAAREMREETRLVIDSDSVTIVEPVSAPDGTLLLFATAPPIERAALDGFKPTPEVSELVVVHTPRPLAWPIHTDMLALALRR